MCSSVVWQWSWAAFAAVLATHGAHGEEAAVPVRGVSPADQAKYIIARGADGAQTFRCLGGQSADSQLHLPFTAVNDEFCDCADGSDEPGTSACAGQKETFFYCRNEQSTASFIYTSHVNDGICDCCDGSDEWSRQRPSPCRNTCPEEGQRLRKELAAREAVWKKGNNKRLKLVEAARVELEQAKKDLATLHIELPSLEAAENTTARALEEAQQAFDAERENAKRNETKEPETKEEEEEKTLEAPAAEKAEEPADKQADKTEERSEEGEAVVSEYTKWMDGADKAMGSTGTVSKAAPPVEETEEDSVDDLDDAREEAAVDADEGLETEEQAGEKERSKGFFEKLIIWNRRVLRTIWRSLFGKSRTPAEIARDSADKVHRDAKRQLDDAKKRLKALDKKVNANHTEEQLAFSALAGRCITKKLSEYKYEVCFFDSAKQGSTSIGNWQRWEGSNVAFFDNGQYCPGGPSRSLRVRFQCGETEEILDVTEPSRCTYEASMSHPGACSGVLPSEAQQGRIRMPSDEL